MAVGIGLDHDRRALRPQLAVVGQRQAAESRDAIGNVARGNSREALIVAAAVAGLAVRGAVDGLARWQRVIAPQPLAPQRDE